MRVSTIDTSQRKAARVVGLAYLLAIPPALFAEFYVLGQLIVSSNAAETARNIMAHERLFRLGTASNLSVFALDVVLITALYVVLKPVNRNLALLAAFWGLIETATLVVMTLNDFSVLRVLSGAEYLRVFNADQLQALARLSISAHGAGYNVGLVFAGLRSTLFCYLWFKSNFIPKPLAALGIFSSLLLAACTFAFIIFPEFAKIVTVEYYGTPIFIFELTMGFWLLLKGIRPSGIAETEKGSDRAQAGAA
jgi:hypothetical protein